MPMKILFSKSIWEMNDRPMRAFLDRAAADGFDAVEVSAEGLGMEPGTFRGELDRRGLRLVSQVCTSGETPAAHRQSLETRLRQSSDIGPDLVSCHTGKDHFPFEENAALFRRSLELGRDLVVPVVHETHRGRALFSAPATAAFLKALPELRINADFSHWVNVHESDLSDQSDAVELAIQRSHFLHARVGHSQGPQASHPLAPEWKPWLDLHVGWWRRILDRRKAEGTEEFFITPEAGPPPYMPTVPFTGKPVADAWEVNVKMRDWLRDELARAGFEVRNDA
jgi:sugar phosphate isomerase/epimerase